MRNCGQFIGAKHSLMFVNIKSVNDASVFVSLNREEYNRNESTFTKSK